MRQDGYVKQNPEQRRNQSKPSEPKQKTDDPKVPPPSETWVEGQPESDKDYPE